MIRAASAGGHPLRTIAHVRRAIQDVLLRDGNVIAMLDGVAPLECRSGGESPAGETSRALIPHVSHMPLCSPVPLARAGVTPGIPWPAAALARGGELCLCLLRLLERWPRTHGHERNSRGKGALNHFRVFQIKRPASLLVALAVADAARESPRTTPSTCLKERSMERARLLGGQGQRPLRPSYFAATASWMLKVFSGFCFSQGLAFLNSRPTSPWESTLNRNTWTSRIPTTPGGLS